MQEPSVLSSSAKSQIVKINIEADNGLTIDRRE